MSVETQEALAEHHRHALGIQAVNLGLVVNLVLALLKTAIGVAGHSSALLADGINSTSDVAYYVVVRVFMQLARKPADREHPLGHSQLESIAALVVGAFVITTAVAIFWDAINKVFDLVSGQGEFGGAALITLAVALSTVGIKMVLFQITRRIARSIRNAAVAALAYDHRNDIFAASAAAVGIFLGRSGLPWVDPLAGALVALLILRTGIKIMREATTDLMDNVPSAEIAEQVQTILRGIPAVRQVEEVYTHRFGPYLVINLTIGVDGGLSVATGDLISLQVERALYQNIDLLRRVHVHYHPVNPVALKTDTLPRSVRDLRV